MKFIITESQGKSIDNMIQRMIDSTLDIIKEESDDWGMGEMDELDEVSSVDKIVVNYVDKTVFTVVSITIHKNSKREDFDFSKLQGENREMFVKLSDLQSEIAIGLMPKYSMPKMSNEQSWRTVMKVISNKSRLTPNEASNELFEFVDKLVELIKKYFPNETMKGLEDKIINFNETLNNL